MSKLWEKKVTLQAFQKKNEFPETPGVYFFLDEQDQLLYIGKATSLRDRVTELFYSGYYRDSWTEDPAHAGTYCLDMGICGRTRYLRR
jgi:hypothetical protein